MCDYATQQILDTIISGYVRDRKIFTALNVSRAAQISHGISLKHNDMKGQTHRNYADGMMQFDKNGSSQKYQRQLVDIAGVNIRAWAYYPPGIGIDNYDLTALRSDTIDTIDTSIRLAHLAQSSAVLMATAAGTLPPTLSKKYKLDKRKRLWIPKDILKSIGANSGEAVDVEIDGKTLVLCNMNGNIGGPPKASYKVDRRGNVAISHSVFKSADMSSLTYEIIEMNKKIVVQE